MASPTDFYIVLTHAMQGSPGSDLVSPLNHHTAGKSAVDALPIDLKFECTISVGRPDQHQIRDPLSDQLSSPAAAGV
jgi:hypothetical protein